MKQALYTCKETMAVINSCIDEGYECIQLSAGTLGVGDWVLIAPVESHFNIVIREIALNEWNSGHTIRRQKHLSQRLLSEIKYVQSLIYLCPRCIEAIKSNGDDVAVGECSNGICEFCNSKSEEIYECHW